MKGILINWSQTYKTIKGDVLN